MKGISFCVCVPGFCYFRKPTNTAYLDTYPIPPPTTILGMIANVLGLRRGDYRLQDELLVGVRNNQGEVMEEYAQLLKEPKSYFPENMYQKDEYMDYLRLTMVSGDSKDLPGEKVLELANKKIKNDGYKVRSNVIEYSTSPMKRRVILNADYTMYLASENEAVLNTIKRKLISPERPVYLGASDSIADIYNVSNVFDIIKEKSNTVHTACTGIHDNGILLKLPYKFSYINKKVNMIYTPIITLFDKYPAITSEQIEVYKFNNEFISLM